MKKAIKALKYLVLTVLGAVLLYGICAVSLSLLGTSADQNNCSAHHEAYVSSNGVHLFLIMPLKDLPDDFIRQLGPPAQARYMLIGWGDQGFYLNTPTWDDLRFDVAVNALLWPSEAAMHLSYYPRTYPSWERVELCEAQSKKLSRFVVSSFKLKNGHFEELHAQGYSANNYFYKARGSYTCFKTSNVWVNNALKEAGVKTSLWSPFDWGVMYHLRK